MKFRNGFVSNSSSSSFVCDVCGEVEIIDEDYEPLIFHCENDHEFHADEQVPTNKISKKMIKDYAACKDKKNYYRKILKKDPKISASQAIKDYLEYMSGYDVAYIHCPICSMRVVMDCDVFRYVCKVLNKNVKEIAQEIKDKFSSYEAFMEFINEN